MDSANTKVAAYRFGPYEFAPATHRLTKYGTRLKLERKPAMVLLCLLENRGRLVSREELQRILWPENTFVDFELGLRVAVGKLRQALGDSAESPAYIGTAVGSGYCWIAPVEAVTPDAPLPVAVIAVAESRADADTAGAPLPGAVVRWFRNSPAAWAAAGVLACLCFLAVLAARSRPKISYHSNDWVLVSDFENRSGDASLDGVLQAALERELNNSRFVHVIPRERVHDLLALMRRPGNAPVTEDVGRELCIRDGAIKLLLAGRVEKLGTTYVLGVNVVDPRNGATLHASSTEAESDSDIIAAVHRLGDDLRAALGEEVGQIKLTDRQLEKVTTPSLAALKLFYIGYDLQVSGQFERSADFLREAVEADPDFATAWVHLAYTHPYTAEGMQEFRRAFELADRVSERERLFIQGSWYWINGQNTQSLRAYELLVNLYPDHYWGVGNVSSLLDEAGRDAEAQAMCERHYRLRPNFGTAVDVWIGLRADHSPRATAFLDEARALARRTGDPALGFYSPYLDAMELWQNGDARAASARLADAKPLNRLQTWEKASLYAAMGQLRAAEEVAASPEDAPHVEMVNAFLRQGVAGLRRYSREHRVPAKWFRSHDLFLFAAANLDATHRSALERRVSSLSPLLLPEFRMGVRGEMEFRRGDNGNAIRDLTETLRASDSSNIRLLPTTAMFLADSLATAYEANGETAAAIKVLEKEASDVNNMGAYLVFWPLVQRHLADLYRATGQAAKAEAIEQKLSALLSLADPDYSLDAQRGLSRARMVVAAIH